MINNLENLYRQVIMEHYKYPRNKGLVKDDDSYKLIHLNNPSCGDDINIQIKVNENNIVEDIRHDGHGCSICCSSASVMTEAIKGKSVEEATIILDNFLKMIKGEDFSEEIDMMDARIYQGVVQFPARIKCATLAWKALEKGLVDEKE